eukprot:gene56694-biopygen79643
MVRRVEELVVILKALWNSVVPFFHVTMLFFFIIFLFAIAAVMLFAGKLNACTRPDVVGVDSCWGAFVGSDEVLRPAAWQRPDHHFDNVGNAMLTLFEVATLSEWSRIVHSTRDIVGEGLQPIMDHSVGNVWFFDGFIV